MKLLFHLTILVVALLLCAQSLAQAKTAAGYCVSAQGDTVKGVFPNYVQWSHNPSAVEFVATNSDKPTKLTPQNCRKFVIEGGDEYLAYIGERLLNPINDYDVLHKRYKSYANEPEAIATFLRLVARAPGCELYVYTDNKRTNLFYKLHDSSVVELIYKKHYHINYVVDVYEYELGSIITTSEYREQLNSLFAERIKKQKLAAALEKLPYTEEKLALFFEQLFAGELIKQKKKGALMGWVVSAGASLNFVNVKAGKSSRFVSKQYHSHISPVLSIGYIAPVSKGFSRYFLFPQLSLFRFKNTVKTSDGTFQTATTYETGMAVLGAVNGGFHVVNRQRIRSYISGGAGIMTLLNNKQQDHKYLVSQPSSEPYRSQHTSTAFKVTPSINASAGTVIKSKFFVALTYLFRTEIDRRAYNYVPWYSGLQLSAGYKL